jgi:hypothetical protein
MRIVLLYVFFVVCTLIFISSKGTGNEHFRYEKSSCQSTKVTISRDCVVSENTFSQKMLNIEFNSFKLLHRSLIENTNSSKTELFASASFLRLYQTKVLGFKPLLKKPFLISLLFNSGNGDDQHLS